RDPFRGRALGFPGEGDVLHRGRSDPAVLEREDIIRYATGCSDNPAGVRPTHYLPGSIGDRVQGIAHARFGHIVEVLLGVARRTPQGVRVIGPRIGDVAPDAEHSPVGGVTQVVISRAAFDV